MRALRLLPALLGAGLLLTLVAPTAAAYTCTPVGPNTLLCDINDDGVPDVYNVWVPGQATLILVAYHDDVVTSVGAAYVTYGSAGFHSGGASAGCYDPNQDLDCDSGSVAVGSTDLGYLDLQKSGDRVRLCSYQFPVLGYSCRPLL